MKRLIPVFLCGLVFALGLGVAGMTQPVKIINFLDVTGHWDPTLLAVMGGALIPTFVLYRLILRRGKPVFADGFSLPRTSPITGRLLAGAALFGVGWGLSGYCPGPAVVALMSLTAKPLVLVLGTVGGMLLYDRIWPLIANRATAAAPAPQGTSQTDG